MEDNYFDKKLKGILESSPDIEPNEADTLDMLQKLRANKTVNRNYWPLLALALFFLPLIYGGLYAFNKFNALNGDILTLTKTIDSLSEKQKLETIIEKQIIHHYDTIHTYTVVYKEINESKINAENSFTKSLKNQISTFASQIPNEFLPQENFNYQRWSLENNLSYLLIDDPDSSFSLAKIGVQNSQNSDPNTFKRFTNNQIKLLNLLAAEPFDADFSKFNFLFNDVQKLAASAKKKKRGIQNFVPQSFSFQIGAKPLVLPQSSYSGTAYAFGVGVDIGFNNSTSLFLGGEYISNSFKLSNVADFTAFPIINGNDPSDVLHEMYVSLSYFQIPIELKQQIIVSKKWKPYFSLGLAAVKPLNQDFEYEFLNTFGEYKLTQVLSAGQFSIDNLRLGLGTTFHVSKRINLGTAIQYHHGFSTNEGEYFPLRYFALDLNASYKLFQ